MSVSVPNILWLAKAPEAALEGIRKVVSDVVADMRTSDPKEPALRSSSELV